jgi:hypothetical protein
MKPSIGLARPGQGVVGAAEPYTQVAGRSRRTESFSGPGFDDHGHRLAAADAQAGDTASISSPCPRRYPSRSFNKRYGARLMLSIPPATASSTS